ncbi:MAG: hypothetical protein PHI35_03320 [Victivallaceae bacterium]|nr:hypothetical protein [Victivallaceae bacterium]
MFDHEFIIDKPQESDFDAARTWCRTRQQSSRPLDFFGPFAVVARRKSDNIPLAVAGGLFDPVVKAGAIGFVVNSPDVSRFEAYRATAACCEYCAKLLLWQGARFIQMRTTGSGFAKIAARLGFTEGDKSKEFIIWAS